MRIRTLLIALLLAMLPGQANAYYVDIYESVTRVTGQRDETRLPGLERCFLDQLVKASGDQRLLDDPAAIAMSKDSRFAIREWSYVDLYAGRPIMDEQGTRDRPYLMTVYYKPQRIDEALAKLGRKPWGKDRPQVMIFLKVQHISSNYVLTSHGEVGDLMRESFADATYKYGMPMQLVPQSLLDGAGLTYDTLGPEKLGALDELAKGAGANAALFGMIRWEPKVLGWVVDWSMNWNGASHAWHTEGVNFDAAFRHALAGAAQILSGNGEPK